MTDQAAPRPWRCFVAVPLPGELREDLRTWMTTVRRDGSLDADWRWTDPDGWHLTLAFLGATPADAVPAIVDRLAAVAGESEDFAVAAGGIGAFPGRNRARVLWYGVRDEERRLAELAQRVRAAAGFDDAAAFRPHVTLARARDRHGVPLPGLSIVRLPSAEVPVKSVHLMRSHLGGGPARYESLAEVALSAPSPAGAAR